jgi:predicted lipoprotein with Yx(FWY)xxD motif
MRLPIKHTAKVVLVAGAAAVLLAACGDDGDEGSSASASAGDSSGVVSVESIDGTEVLVDSEGRALYTTEAEQQGKIRCVGSCTADWEPVAASGGDVASADIDAELGTVERPDGTEQLTVDGLPLYSFTQEGPGQLTGDGFVDEFDGTEFEWLAATVDGGSASPDPSTPSDDGGGVHGY